MVATWVQPRRAFSWGPRHSVVLLVALLLPLINFAPAPHSIPRAQPELLRLATSHPKAVVGVIVQTLAHDGGVEGRVVQLGGRVTKHLPIIEAFVAELTARAVPVLARDLGVRWVSWMPQ